MNEMQYWHGCKDKQCYESGEAAQTASKSLKSKGYPKHTKPYKCEFCEYWHIGTGTKNLKIKNNKAKRASRQIEMLPQHKTHIKLAYESDGTDYVTSSAPAVTSLGDLLKEAFNGAAPQ